MRRKRVGVVGAGYMGRLHAAKLDLLARAGEPVALAGVVDIRAARARALARTHGVAAVRDLATLLGNVDAVIVAVPTLAHYEVVRTALAVGVDVLVEKPIASTLDEAESLLSLAKRGELILQVGHLEWFNGAMEVIRKHIRRPRFVEGHRLGPFPGRATDIDVVRDLMIHDLDILQQLLGEEPERIEAIGVPVLSSSIDIANARLCYPCGCVANLTASRVSPAPMRRIRFFQAEGYFSVDFLEQSALVARREPGAPGDAPYVAIEKVDVIPGDALLDQLRDFLRALHTRERPRVDGHGGLGALRTAVRVNAAIASTQPTD